MQCQMRSCVAVLARAQYNAADEQRLQTMVIWSAVRRVLHRAGGGAGQRRAGPGPAGWPASVRQYDTELINQ